MTKKSLANPYVAKNAAIGKKGLNLSISVAITKIKDLSARLKPKADTVTIFGIREQILSPESENCPEKKMVKHRVEKYYERLQGDKKI